MKMIKNKLVKEKEQLLKYKDEVDKIKSAIDILKRPADQLIESKKIYEERQKKFTKYADDLFSLSIAIFSILIALIFISLGFDILSKKADLSLYLILVFPVMFPTVMGFLFTQQANINLEKIEKVNRRFILIHEINNALEALVEINRGKDINGKTEQIIDKLINNILTYNSSNENNSMKEDINIIDLNKKIDLILKSIKLSQ